MVGVLCLLLGVVGGVLGSSDTGLSACLRVAGSSAAASDRAVCREWLKGEERRKKDEGSYDFVRFGRAAPEPNEERSAEIDHDFLRFGKRSDAYDFVRFGKRSPKYDYIRFG